MRRKRKQEYNYCVKCNQKFRPVRSDQLYCCKGCRLRYYKSIRQSIAKDKKAGNL
ncbi:hypothetical protein [Clostridium sp. BNL1100]|uniref:hypothetical protein n=1 Tax=Clostridium sp. BNL1100 TaxID=755731 RepID=UPI00030BEEFE|nr:hypothetical protein [Clostridium sp. BNL1100]